MSNEFKHDPPQDETPFIADLPPPEPEELPPQWEPHHPAGIFHAIAKVLLLLIVLAIVVIPFTAFPGKIKRGLGELVEKARSTKRETSPPIIITKEVIREVPQLQPLPSKFVPRKEGDVATLFNGITVQTKLVTSEGTYATIEGKNPDAYTVEFQVKVRVPKANDTITELARVNEHLPKMLPGLAPMLATAKVSGFYHKLYENKVAAVERNITRFTKILDKHNFFDTETILELQHPVSKRLAMLIQSDMDVVADGSDGDRMSAMGSAIFTSDYYQPSTSYEWAKQGKTPNPLLPKWQARYDAVKKELGNAIPARKIELKGEMQHLEAEIRSLKNRSSLIGEKDPFVVIPLLFKDYPRIMAGVPALGDYCAVIHGNKIFPAICGDYGPSMKMGEASLLIAKAINEKATPYIRGEDELKVTYLIFPGTADKPFGPPNLETWHEKINAYLKEIGGLGDGYALHKWEVQFPKPPETDEESIIKTTPDKKPVDAPATAKKSDNDDDKPKKTAASAKKKVSE